MEDWVEYQKGVVLQYRGRAALEEIPLWSRLTKFQDPRREAGAALQ